jgi:L-alanine-DL-glutamate epimerase-like enolase superfamily enzyme
VRLEELEAIPYSLPFRERYTTSRGELSERELLLVRIRGEGLEGLGETAALSLRGGPGIAEIADELERTCWPALADGGFDPARIWSALARLRSRGASAQAIAAVDLALHDLAGKAAGAPVWKLLGADAASPIKCNATLPAANPAKLRSLAERWAAAGFDTFKLKVGLAGDVTQFAAVREALGPEAVLRVDANAAWGVDEAVERLAAIAHHGLELAEQPVGGLEQMAEVRRRSGIRLVADEDVVTVRDARRAYELRACELATAKLSKVGGIAATLEVAGEIPTYLSSGLEGPVGIAGAAHAVQALPLRGNAAEPAHGLATERLFSESVGRGASLDGDLLTLGEEPGLGVELDEAALAARRSA